MTPIKLSIYTFCGIGFWVREIITWKCAKSVGQRLLTPALYDKNVENDTLGVFAWVC